MKKIISSITIALLFTMSQKLGAQTEGVSIKNSPSAPHPSAMLDIESGSKGLLIPRVALTSTTVAAPVSSPTTGLLVFNTTTSLTIGFYYWDANISGGSWQKMSTGGNSLWSRLAVSGATNNIEYYNGKVQIGKAAAVTTPTFDFEVHSGTSSLSCLFDGPGGLLRWGYNDHLGEAGAGPGNFLTQKSATTTGCDPGPGFTSLRSVMMYEQGDWGFGVTAYGKCKNIKGYTNVSVSKNDLEIMTAQNAALTLNAGQINFISQNNVSMWLPNIGWANISDSTLKKNIASEETVMTKLKEVRPVTYSFKTDGTNKVNHGVIAQEIEEIFPELVTTMSIPNKGEDGVPNGTTTDKKGVLYEGLITILLKAIKEQNEEIESLKGRVTYLETH